MKTFNSIVKCLHYSINVIKNMILYTIILNMLKNMYRNNTGMKYTEILMMVAFRWRVMSNLNKFFYHAHNYFFTKKKFNLITE